MHRRPVNLHRWLAILIVLLAAGLRLHRLDAQSFWNDEGNSARLSERNPRLIIEGTASDIHPPGFYLALHGWRALTGDSEFALRALPAMSGVITVALVIPLGRALTTYIGRRQRPNATLAATALVALNPALVYYSQELRMYAPLAALATLATLLWLRWRRAPRPAGGLAYAVALAAGFYTHYFFIVVPLLHGVLLLGRFDWRAAARWVAWGLVAATLYLPWLPVVLGPLGGNRGVPQPPATFAAGTLRFWLVGHTLDNVSAAIWVSAAVVAAVALIAGASRSHPRYALLWLIALLPAVTLPLLQATDPAFYKFLLLSLPLLAWLLVQPVAQAPAAPARLWPVAAALLLAWPMAPSLDNLYRDPAYARDDYRTMARTVAADPAAGVILSAPNQWEVFTYYYDAVEQVYPLPRSQAPVTAESVAADLRAITAAHDRLYALFWGDRQQDPDGLVETWLNAHTYRVDERWVGDVRFVAFVVPPAAADAPATTLNAAFGEAIVLEGFALSAATVTPGSALALTLFWRAAEPISERYKVFVHLLDDTGQIISQRDAEPQGGLAPTSLWAPDTTLPDKYGVIVPGDTPSGTYSLFVGMYNLADPTDRLPVTRDGALSDAVLLTTITVTRDP